MRVLEKGGSWGLEAAQKRYFTADGKNAELPQHIIQTLSERRAQAQRIGPWVEGHYRPGRNL